MLSESENGEYSLKPGDSYETIARTITQSD